jgi:hypothetical protein
MAHLLDQKSAGSPDSGLTVDMLLQPKLSKLSFAARGHIIMRICLYVTVLLCLTGCTTQISGLVKHESFTYPALIQEKIAIVGIASTIKPIKKKEQNAIGNIIYSSFLEKRRDLSLVKAGDVVTAIGSELRSKSLEEYQLTETIPASILEELKQNLEGICYVIFARIDKDDISQYESITYRAKDGKEISSYKEGAVEVHKRETTRWETVSLHVFDLVLGIPVWGGSVSKSDSRYITFEVTPEKSSLTLKNIALGVLKDTAEYIIADQLGTPQPSNDYPLVGRETVLKKIFHGFAENLPKQKN